MSLQCNVLCGLAPDGAPVCVADDPGAKTPEIISVRLAGGEEALVSGPRDASGAVPGGEVAIAYCEPKTIIHEQKFGDGVWKLGAMLDSRGALRPLAEGQPPPVVRGTFSAAGGSAKDRVKLGAPCSRVALAATAPLAPLASAPPGPTYARSAAATWATLRAPSGDVSLALMDESYDPIRDGGYTEADLKADWGDVGTGGLRPGQCFHLVLRAPGVDDQEVLLPDPYACGEGD
jgi:hypothetical protein